MTPRLLLLAALVVATVVGAYVLTRPAPRPAAGKPVPISGVYADDWMATCGPLQGAEQERCTARLDAAYGRAANQPTGK